jgi:uncharacterized OB-fold protein
MTSTGLVCAACGTELSPDSKFCNRCGSPVGLQHSAAEYKQVTVLFADVVHSVEAVPVVPGFVCLGRETMMRRRRRHVASGPVHDPLSCFLDLPSGEMPDLR